MGRNYSGTQISPLYDLGTTLRVSAGFEAHTASRAFPATWVGDKFQAHVSVGQHILVF